MDPNKRRRRISLFWLTIGSLVVIYLLLKFGLPFLSMFIAGRDHPLPIPAVAMQMYIILAIIASALYITFSPENTRDFLAPALKFLKGPGPASPRFRSEKIRQRVVLVVIPLIVGGFIYAQAAPRVQSPTLLRIQHPTIPGAYEKLQNPWRNPSDDAVKAFLAEAKLEKASLEEGRKLLVEKYIEEGRILYQINCRPCHGTKADGKGEMARGFRLKPVDFTDPGTIATLVEAYALWRVKEGGPGLPADATPWDSAMPVWKDELTDEQIWKIVMAEYEIAGKEPRMPEKLK